MTLHEAEPLKEMIKARGFPQMRRPVSGSSLIRYFRVYAEYKASRIKIASIAIEDVYAAFRVRVAGEILPPPTIKIS
jgi:hypothetical protein